MGRRTCGAIQPKARKEEYAKRFAITELNRKRKQAKHQKMVDKKAAEKLSFSVVLFKYQP